MIVFFTLHLLVSGLAAWYVIRRKQYSREFLAALVIIVLLPIVGLLVSWLLFVCKHAEGHSADMDDSLTTVHDMQLFELVEPLNISQEVNVAPLEETLLIADFSKRREIILNILKQDESSQASYVNLALYNDDAETAHYAASGILHRKRKLDTSLNLFSSLHKNDPSDRTVAYAYADLLRQYLTLIRLDPVDRLFFIYENIHVLERIYSNEGNLSLGSLIRLIDLQLEVESFTRATALCDILWQSYPDSEEKYLTLLKSYFIMKDKDRFELVFKSFRNSDLYFSSETMHVIRLWLGSVNDMIVKS